MKKIVFICLFFASGVFLNSCKDEALDPLQVSKIQKGKLLALRGTQLQNIYVKGIPGAEFFPKIETGTSSFVFEAEYLAENNQSLESVDVFVLKKATRTATPDRVLVKNVPFSDFKNDGKYRNPYVTVTLSLSDVLSKLGLPTTFPMSAPTITTLLDVYKFGIGIESDLNLKDGSKALAANVVAAGLFASDQFYPAQKLSWAVTDYCSYVASSWAGAYDANEIYSNGVYGPYTLSFSQDGTDPNRFNTINFWDSGYTAYIVFSPSTNPGTQTVNFPAQTVGGGGSILAGSKGTYNQCTGEVSISLTYQEGTAQYPFRYSLVKK
ncbi:MAG: hypothetical protein JSU09_10640 [Bacteroidetes bacterium]|nr:hypothetical protein [Bacteroidota bacterium]